MIRKPLVEADVTFYGIDHDQYFTGHGVSFTEFTRCVTGVGDTASEALDDAIESMAQTASFSLDDVRIPMLGAARKEAAQDGRSVYAEQREEVEREIDAARSEEEAEAVTEEEHERAVDAAMEAMENSLYFYVGLSWIDPEDGEEEA